MHKIETFLEGASELIYTANISTVDLPTAGKNLRPLSLFGCFLNSP